MAISVRDTSNPPDSAAAATVRQVGNLHESTLPVRRIYESVRLHNRLSEIAQDHEPIYGLPLWNVPSADPGSSIFDASEIRIGDAHSRGVAIALTRGYRDIIIEDAHLWNAVPNFTGLPDGSMCVTSVLPGLRIGLETMFAIPERHNIRVYAPETQIRHQKAYESRIERLRGFVEEDDDVEAVNEESVKDFWSFMKTSRFTRRAGLVMLDSGNLRVVWRDDVGQEVGLHFLGDSRIFYAIFTCHSDGSDAEPVIDTTTFEGVPQLLRELDLISFVNE